MWEFFPSRGEEITCTVHRKSSSPAFNRRNNMQGQKKCGGKNKTRFMREIPVLSLCEIMPGLQLMLKPLVHWLWCIYVKFPPLQQSIPISICVKSGQDCRMSSPQKRSFPLIPCIAWNTAIVWCWKKEMQKRFVFQNLKCPCSSLSHLCSRHALPTKPPEMSAASLIQ